MRRWAVRVLQGAAGTAALFLAAELLSSAWLDAPLVDRTPLVEVEPSALTGYRLRPLQESFTYQASVQTNAQGLRERTWTATEAAGRRVLFVGGSETFGKGVAVEDAFPRQVEQRTQGRLRSVNAGTPDWNLEQSLAFIEAEASRYRPHVIVLSLAWDDLFVDASMHAQPVAPEREGGQWFVRRWATQSGALRWLAPVYTRSRVLCAARNALKSSWARHQGLPSYVWRQALLNDETTPELEQAWGRAQAQLKAWAQRAHSQDYEAWLLIHVFEQQVRGERWGFQRRARAAAAQAGLQVIDPSPCYKGGVDLFIPYDGRPSVQGHGCIAGAVHRALSYQQTP